MNQSGEEQPRAKRPSLWADPRIVGLITALFIAGWVALALYRLSPPAAVAPDAPPTEFSSGRALEHVRAIAQRPRPVGTAEHAAAREYLVGALNGLGLRTEVQQAEVFGPVGPLTAATVHNILGRLEGTASTRAILLVAHYDSVSAGPGANDDGAAVAALLETVRALRAGPPLRNDVIVLLSDGEEPGLLGAQAFVDQHPWGKQPALVLNFEARGGGGPVFLFETNTENGWLIEQFGRSAPRMFASSLFYEVYRFLPNNTDFTVFKRAGIDGLNFAYIDDFTTYHSPIDNAARVGERSLQHHGEYALALARHFGDLDLANIRAGNSVFFDLLGAALVRYPEWLVLPLLGLLALVLVGVLVAGFRRRRLSFRGILLGFFALLLNLVLAALLVIPLQLLMGTHNEFRFYGDTYNRTLYLAGLLALILALTAALGNLFGRRTRVENLAMGALIWWFVLAAITSALVPGGSYLFVWPLLFSLLALGVVVAAPEGRAGPAPHTFALLLGAVPALLLMAPVIYLLFIALTARLGFVTAVAMVLLLGLLTPHLSLIAQFRRWLLPAVAALLGMVFLLAGVLTARPTPDRPRLNDVLYGLDADSGQAIWATGSLVGDEWTEQFVGAGGQVGPLEYFPFSPAPFRRAEAPAVPLAAPTATLIEDRTEGDVRTLRLRIVSARRAPLLWVHVDRQTEIRGAALNGVRSPRAVPAPGAGPAWSLTYWAPPEAGIEVTLEVRAGTEAMIRVVDRVDGLPEIPGASFRPRPETMAPAPVTGIAGLSNATLVSKAFRF